MSEQLSRQARRELARQQVKEQFKMTNIGTTVSQETLDLFKKQITVLNNNVKILDHNVWLMIETLERGGYMKWEDLQETEKIYMDLNAKKAVKVKELLAQDLDLPEMIALAREDQALPKLERLNINPFRDLNCNPYQFAQFLMEETPNLSKEEYIKIGQSWGLTPDHFGYEKGAK